MRTSSRFWFIGAILAKRERRLEISSRGLVWRASGVSKLPTHPAVCEVAREAFEDKDLSQFWCELVMRQDIEFEDRSEPILCVGKSEGANLRAVHTHKNSLYTPPPLPTHTHPCWHGHLPVPRRSVIVCRSNSRFQWRKRSGSQSFFARGLSQVLTFLESIPLVASTRDDFC